MLAGKAKKVKDPNAPKKPLTTYMRYAATVRAGIREENPDFKVFVCVYISSPFAYMYASIYVNWKATCESASEEAALCVASTCSLTLKFERRGASDLSHLL